MLSNHAYYLQYNSQIVIHNLTLPDNFQSNKGMNRIFAKPVGGSKSWIISDFLEKIMGQIVGI